MPTQQVPLHGLKFAIDNVQNGDSLDLYMRLQTPASAGWGAIGIGTAMEGASIFLTYASSNDSSSTLSVRKGTGDSQPRPFHSPMCHQIEGSTSATTIDTAWVCPGLGDDARLKGNANSDWIYALGPGVEVKSNSVGAQIEEHQTRGFFNVDMNAAMTSAPSQPNGVPMITAGGSSAGVSTEVETSPSDQMVMAHAILLGAAFLILFPLGTFLLRLKSTRLHWMTQTFASIVAIIGWIIAIFMCATTTEFAAFDETHQILGIVTVALLFPQFVIGAINHGRYKSTGKGTWLAFPHITLGRSVVVMGMVNGILGFILYGNKSGAIGYGIGSGVVIVAMAVLAVWDLMRRSKEVKDAQPRNGFAMKEYESSSP